MFKSFDFKLGRMRKPQNWIVQPTSEKDVIICQSDKSIAMLNFKTGKGKLNTKGSYFYHLSLASPFEFPKEFIDQALKCCPSLNSETKLGGVTFKNTVIIF